MAGARDAPSGWLRGPELDLASAGGVLALALIAGAVAMQSRALFMAVLLADLWLLAYPHVASTFTRIAFDRESARRHRFLLLGLPPLVLAGTAGAAWVGGAVALNTIYFYWQSFHYVRQSDGIARAYRRASGATGQGRDLATDGVVYGFPIWGLLHRIDQRPTAFYGAPFVTPSIPGVLVTVAGVAAFAALALWMVRQLRALRAGEPVLGGAVHVAAHVVVTVVGYVAVDDITSGWLFVNIWHNAQYLLFVWTANVRRFQRPALDGVRATPDGVRASGDGRAPNLVAWLSQPRNAAWYAAACLVAGGAFYLALGRFSAALPQDVLPMVLVLHLAVNFHHYLVDAVIWRAPRRPASPRTPQRAS